MTTPAEFLTRCGFRQLTAEQIAADQLGVDEAWFNATTLAEASLHDGLWTAGEDGTIVCGLTDAELVEYPFTSVGFPTYVNDFSFTDDEIDAARRKMTTAKWNLLKLLWANHYTAGYDQAPRGRYAVDCGAGYLVVSNDTVKTCWKAGYVNWDDDRRTIELTTDGEAALLERNLIPNHQRG